ncbi:Hsp20/alpha crystallin family protein [Saccharicrinis fermentans]|uniref:SHSP domain-containing protein n=1 Tax=Saccharicrinis fermentans DSM 9555 = JCM 21142 TaxID=869213 RepID=W7Y2J9_9BACT|nr:Hsp20/alpha crystallin family protein [Saccharicrinis fermentans]GAF01778.1 hypothetical protein JCM21142_395 [Saccharicrinis fermentans DSM 9555 = JCM 21142]
MTLARLSNQAFPSFPSFFDRFFDNDLMDWSQSNLLGTQSTLPAVNVAENDIEFHIEVAAPGMKKDDFKLNYNNGILTISSEHKDEKEDKQGGKITRKEYSYQAFQRSFELGENSVKVDEIKASYSDGILHITLPKSEALKPRPVKTIPIS